MKFVRSPRPPEGHFENLAGDDKVSFAFPLPHALPVAWAVWPPFIGPRDER